MSEFDYGNARLRAMKSRMLSRRTLESLVEHSNLQGLIAALTKTDYRKPVEASLAQTTGLECIDGALRNDLIFSLQKVRSFYDGQAGELVALRLRAYDVQNLKAVLHGLDKQAASGEVLAAVLPVGDLGYALLVDLSAAAGPRDAIDQLVSMNLPHARPLLELRARRPGAGTFEMGLALERWYFREAQEQLKSMSPAGEHLLSAFNLEADLVNLATVLRIAHEPAERKLLRERLGTDDVSCLFVGPGFLSTVQLVRAAGQEPLEAAVGEFSGTLYASPLNAGLEAYARSGRLSEIEKQLRRFRLVRIASLIQKDALGIGVFLGYLALKVNEITNLRWIARGVHMGLTPPAIRAELEFTA